MPPRMAGGTGWLVALSFKGPFALHLTVEDGRITRHRLYENSLSMRPAPHECAGGRAPKGSRRPGGRVTVIRL
ncbi:hypothetical protein [Streptomyces scabichelini]|uniref:hypothetical protein n=1 Tax=Streptomyces scabichelini TaxID=2711217 RepID=UPI001F49CF8D|nr:hypothetical protein [Streptomyces scabichelini]